MQIDDKVFVAIDYKLTLASGEEVDSSPEGQPFGFITGSGQVISGLENQLMGKEAGHQSKITVEPEEGYGEVNDKLFQEVPRDQLPADCEVEAGMTFQAQGPQGPVLLNIKDVADNDMVIVDLNHPLAGKQLHFDINVVEVREATTDELAELEQQSAGCGCGCETPEPSNCGSGCNCG